MGLKQCDNCSEMVDAAKAFCPGCGSAFVEEEKRKDTSEFEKLDNTVQLGQTMYNQMLSDMGLNISDAPSSDEKSVEVLEPAKTRVFMPVPAAVIEPVRAPVPDPIPAAVTPQVQEVIEPPAVRFDTPKPASNTKWYILGGVGVVILFPIALASTIFLVFEILARLK